MGGSPEVGIIDSTGALRWYLMPDSIFEPNSIEWGGVMMGFRQNKDGALTWGYGQRYVKYDIMGREVFNRLLPYRFNDISHSVDDAQNGHYFLRVASSNYLRPDGKHVRTVRDVIAEVDENGVVVDEWRLADILDPYRDNVLKVLDQGAVCLNIDASKAGQTLSAAERYPAGVSGFVRIELDPDGTERLLPAGVSLYDGYAFRSLQPEAVTVGYDLTLSEAPTSAREAAAQLARRLAERRGAEVAVRCDSAGILRSADDAPLLAIAGRTVLTAPGPASVERRLAMLAVRAAGLELSEEAFGRADLPSLDELFFADHRGVTSLSRCDGLPLMTFVAERIAEAMEGLFPKK